MDYISIQEQAQHYVRSLFNEYTGGRLIYHNLYHTEKVVAAATEIAQHYNLTGRDLFIVTLAAWFHDTGYLKGEPAGHEERGAGMMEAFLGGSGTDRETVAAIRACILATKIPQSPANLLENIVCDADLFHLGTNEFGERNKLMRKEAGIFQGRKISKEEWRKGTIRFLESHHYHTDYCQSRLDWKQHENLAVLLAKESDAIAEAGKDQYEADEKDGDESSERESGVAEKKEEKKERKKGEELQFLTAQPNKKGRNGAGRGVDTMFKIASTNHQRLSRQADSKAHILIQVNAIIISVLLSLLLRKIDDHMNLVIPGIILLTVNLLTIIFSILATRPHISEGTFSKTDLETKKVNLLFFGNFYRMSLQDYTEGMLQVMEDQDFLYGSLVKDLYFQGIALGRKFRWLRLSYNVFMFGLIIAVISFVVAALASPYK